MQLRPQPFQGTCSRGSSRRTSRPHGPAHLPRRGLSCVCQLDSGDKRGSLVPSTEGFSLSLAKAPTQAAAFGFLSATSGVLAVGALAAPELILDLLLPLPDVMGRQAFAGLDPTLLRVLGATLIISSAAEYCLQDAAANNRLNSATYQRLMVACVVKSTGYLLAFAQAPTIWTPLLLATYPTAAILSVVVNTSVLLATNRDPATGEQKTPALLPNLAPTNLTSTGYLVMVGLYVLTALACYGPTSLFTGEEDVSSLLIRHSWAPGFLLAAVAALNLKDAADRGRLGASTFKRLNLGLGSLELVYSVIFLSAMLTRTADADFAGVSNLVFSLGISAFCFNQWLFAKK